MRKYERVSFRRLPKDQYANCGTTVPKVCNFTNHEKSGKISVPAQCHERFNLNFKENFFDILNLDVFCDKGMAIPQIRFGFFLAFEQYVWPFSDLFLALFGYLLKFSSGNPARGRQQQLISLQVRLSASFSNCYWIAYKYFRFCSMQIDLSSPVTFSNNRFFGMGMTHYSCITPIAQMSRKRYYLRAKTSGCRLLFNINQCCHWGQSR